MRTEVSAKLSKLSAIGITTGQYYEGGKLYIDEEKLKKALENDPESIMNLFQGAANAPSEGLFDKLAKVTDTAMINLSDKAGTTKNSGDPKSIFLVNSSMGKILEDYNKRITAMQRRLDDQETRYYKQFTAMETAMGKLNSQSSLFATG